MKPARKMLMQLPPPFVLSARPVACFGNGRAQKEGKVSGGGDSSPNTTQARKHESAPLVVSLFKGGPPPVATIFHNFSFKQERDPSCRGISSKDVDSYAVLWLSLYGCVSSLPSPLEARTEPAASMMWAHSMRVAACDVTDSASAE